MSVLDRGQNYLQFNVEMKSLGESLPEKWTLENAPRNVIFPFIPMGQKDHDCM